MEDFIHLLINDEDVAAEPTNYKVVSTYSTFVQFDMLIFCDANPAQWR